MIGGDQWGELLDAPWMTVHGQEQDGKELVAQFASALRRGELWSKDGTHVLTRIKMARLGDMLSVGPQHRQIRGDLGVI